MATTRHPSAVRTRGAPGTPVPGSPGARRPGLLVPAAVAVLLAVGCITLGPAGFVADARRAVLAGVEVLTAPWPGTVHRAQVEAVANVLLFVPVGALAALALRRSGPVLPLAVGAATSVLVELAQTALPGRVPDLVDVAANTAGTVVGVALSTVLLAPARRAAGRRGGARRPRRGLRAAVVTVPLLVAGVTGCSSAGPAGPAGAPGPGTPGAATLTAEDGYVPEGDVLSPFADVPAITGLDSALRAAVQDAARYAAADGVPFHVSSGWRSAAYQQALLDAAVERYGSADAARAYVLGPDESAHVTGRAVDIGPTDAMSWLARHGADFGLCQTYANEMWHFELAVERGGRCPAPARDARAG